MTDLPATGLCRCGAMELTVSQAPVMTAACHCDGCRKMSASAFSLTMMVPASGFAVTRGDPAVGGARAPDCQHWFCPHCMSWMYTRIPGMDGLVNLRPSMFDVPAWSEPFIETMCARKLPWVTTPAAHRFEAFPPAHSFEALMQAYAAQL